MQKMYKAATLAALGALICFTCLADDVDVEKKSDHVGTITKTVSVDVPMKDLKVMEANIIHSMIGPQSVLDDLNVKLAEVRATIADFESKGITVKPDEEKTPLELHEEALANEGLNQ